MDSKPGDDDDGLSPTIQRRMRPPSAPTLNDKPAAVAHAADNGPPRMPTPTPVPSPSPVASPPIASSLQRYRLGPVLGRGGMGEVVSAHDDQIGRSVAIKRMREPGAPVDAVARLLREARIQGRLEHPAVVPVHELRHDAGSQPFFVMKQLAGVTLADVLNRLAVDDSDALVAYTRQRLLRAFCDVCLAIEFAHTRGVVHRDLKPANIVIGDFGEVYVLDWGIAGVVGVPGSRAGFTDIDASAAEAALAARVAGTPGYMAPEQIRGDGELDGRTDVYALGCILFELLALAPLHPRGEPALRATLAGTHERASTRAPTREIPPELDAVCLAATMFDRADRFATARELADAVERFLDGDRDLALRRDLARTELEAANAALARGDGAAERRVAIRAAARALALDPTNPEPAELVGRLMLEPPIDVPPEVEAAVAADDVASLDGARPLIVRSAMSFLAFVPVFWWAGLRDPRFLVTGVVLSIAMTLVAWRTPIAARKLMSRVILAGWLITIVMFSLVTTPFVVVPGVAIVVGMSIATLPVIASARVLVALLFAAILGPWLLALAGVLPQHVAIVGNAIVLQMTAGALDPSGAMVGLAAYVLAMTAVGVVLARSLLNGRRAAQRLVQIQAWQLRQLLPRAASQTLANARELGRPRAA